MGRKNNYIDESPLASTSAGINTVSSNVVIRGWDGLAVVAQYTANAPGAKGFVDGDVTVATNVVNEAAHGYETGLLGALTTDGVLPTGLSAQDYYIIDINANYYQFATTAALAEAGTPVNITAAAGGGTHTFTPDAANVAIQYQGALSLSGPFVTISTETVTTTSTNILWNVDRPHYKICRVRFQVNAGQGTFKVDTSKESD